MNVVFIGKNMSSRSSSLHVCLTTKYVTHLSDTYVSSIPWTSRRMNITFYNSLICALKFCRTSYTHNHYSTPKLILFIPSESWTLKYLTFNHHDMTCIIPQICLFKYNRKKSHFNTLNAFYITSMTLSTMDYNLTPFAFVGFDPFRVVVCFLVPNF